MCTEPKKDAFIISIQTNKKKSFSDHIDVYFAQQRSYTDMIEEHIIYKLTYTGLKLFCIEKHPTTFLVNQGQRSKSHTLQFFQQYSNYTTKGSKITFCWEIVAHTQSFFLF